jgi:2-amino-4-hydroxy-6-hydroxymethyldihydropteridine diphosphokinase
MIVIALGTNLPSKIGTPRDTLSAALPRLTESGIRIVRVSPFYASQAWPDPNDPPFVNAVALVETELSPAQVMASLHAIEAEFGRVRGAKNSPRTLDLDLVDYDGRVEDGPPVLPHPRMRDRAFVLVPLADVVPGWRYPVSGKTVEELIAALPDRGRGVTPSTRRASRRRQASTRRGARWSR